MSSVSRSLSLVQDIISAFLAAMLMALCAMPRRLLFMSWSSMTCSLRRLTSAESGAGAAAAPASASAPAAAAPLSTGSGLGVGALSRASRPGFGVGGAVARASGVFPAPLSRTFEGTFEQARVTGAAAGCPAAERGAARGRHHPAQWGPALLAFRDTLGRSGGTGLRGAGDGRRSHAAAGR